MYCLEMVTHKGSTNVCLEGNFISNKFPTRPNRKVKNTLGDSICESAILNSINKGDLQYLLFSLKPNKDAAGMDGIRVTDLRRNFSISKKNILLFLANEILEFENFPCTVKNSHS